MYFQKESRFWEGGCVGGRSSFCIFPNPHIKTDKATGWETKTNGQDLQTDAKYTWVETNLHIIRGCVGDHSHPEYLFVWGYRKQ